MTSSTPVNDWLDKFFAELRKPSHLSVWRLVIFVGWFALFAAWCVSWAIPAVELDSPLSRLHPVELSIHQLWLNWLPAMAIGWLFLALTGRLLAAAALIAAFFTALHSINETKLVLLGVPIIASDFPLIANSFSHWHVLTRYVEVDFPSLFRGLLVLVALGLSWRFEPRALTVLSRLALAGLAVAFFMGALSSGPIYRWYQSDLVRSVVWEPALNYRDSGLVATLLNDLPELASDLPDRDLDSYRDLISKLPTISDLPRPDPLPDIVVVMSESFFEPELLEGVGVCQHTPRFCELQARSQHGRLTVPTFGGLTLQTEFEFLAGVSLRHFPGHRYPYYTLVKKPMHSLASNLGKLGYQSTYLHPNRQTFWNRHVVMPLFGFDQLIDIAEFDETQRVGYYISDRAMTERVIDLLSQVPAAGSPQFVFAVSMENHGPWGVGRPNLDPDVLETIATPADLSTAAQLQWREYAYHVENADRELGRLMDFLDQRDRETLLLFFGDHLPGLPLVYSAMPSRSGLKPYKLPTPYLILSNRNMVTGKADMTVDQLANSLLNAAGLCVDAHCHYSTRLAEMSADEADQLGIVRETGKRALQLERYYRELDEP